MVFKVMGKCAILQLSYQVVKDVVIQYKWCSITMGKMHRNKSDSDDFLTSFNEQCESFTVCVKVNITS